MVLQGVLGLLTIIVLAWALSEQRQLVRWRVVGIGLALQLIIALALLKIPFFNAIFLELNKLIIALQEATTAGTSFVFGYLGGGDLPFSESSPGSSFILAFQALPLILVMSALSALLFYWKILPLIVKAFAKILQGSMGTGGALGFGAAANIFVGMIEAPLLIRPYLEKLTRAELFALMVTGMATIAGTMMALYASVLSSLIPDALGHLLTASLISAPAALLIAHLMVPEQKTITASELHSYSDASSSMDAITQGTMAGLKLLANVIALLVVLVALVSLLNQILGLLPMIDNQALSLERILGWLLSPLAWLMGVPWDQAQVAGSLLGTKVVLNEFLAYLQFTGLPANTLDAQSNLIMTYALCGFANFGSLGIMIGGMSAMAPSRHNEITELGMKSIVAGTLATCMTGAVAGLITQI